MLWEVSGISGVLIRPTMAPRLSQVLLLSILVVAVCFEPSATYSLRRVQRIRPRAQQAVALAKKKSKPRNPEPQRPVGLSAPMGFSSPAATPSSSRDASASSGSSGRGGGGSSSSLDRRLDEVLREAGVTRSSTQAEEAKRGPADPLSRIPKAGHELLERFFGGGAIVFGSTFILSGIAVSVEAVCKVLDKPLPTAVDEVLVQYIEPCLTPSILILFFFSISLGLLKQLQLGSEQAGVLYVERDDD